MSNTDQVLKLAAIIREVDGNHSKGAAALAELILDHPSFHQCCNAPTAPSDGEVAELVDEAGYLGRELRDQADDLSPSLELFGLMQQAAAVLTRAAELLERQAPVPVSERLPGPKDCDAEGRCWWGTPDFVNSCTVTQSAQWRLSAPDDRFGSELFWLPAHALPLPEVGE